MKEFIRNNEKLNHTSWWDKMYAAHLENGIFFESSRVLSALFVLKTKFIIIMVNLYNGYYSMESIIGN